MVRRTVRVGGRDEASVAVLRRRFEAIRTELGIPQDFPPAVLAAAEKAAADPQPPEEDLGEVPFLTVDPPGSTDLDQALHLSRRDGSAPAGYHVAYAIADVPAFVLPEGPVDAEARRRGQTLYAPDRRTPLHPEVLSEGAASLLPGEVRAAAPSGTSRGVVRDSRNQAVLPPSGSGVISASSARERTRPRPQPPSRAA